MKKIGIDLDSTLNNLTGVWLNMYNNEYNDNLPYFSEWFMDKEVKRHCGKKIYDYLHLPKLFYDLDINPGARETVEFLSEHYELYIITAYIPSSCLDKVNWVKKHLPNFKIENIVFVNDKSLLELDYLLDDGPLNIISFKYQSVIYDQMYNRYLGDKYPRVNDWKGVKKYFQYELIKNNKLKVKQRV